MPDPEIRGGEKPEPVLGESLTRRERDVLALLARGYSGPEIAAELTLALSSVKSHMQHLYGKLGVNSKRQAVARARELGLLDPTPRLGEDTSPPAGTARLEDRRASTLHSNLPVQLTSFIGREKEMAEVKRLLSGQRPDPARLVTLTGAGGTGKTRLALQVAGDMLAGFPDGACLVALAPLSNSATVLPAVATALDVRDEPGRPLLASLVSYLRAKHLLLLLDNCEHMIDACAQLAESLLSACPRLKILATSREGLAIAGEICFQVPTLSVPDMQGRPAAGTLAQSEAVRLFVDRAGLALPGFAVTDQNAPALAEVCRQLDGIPLAIELAAARVKLLSVEQIAARLDDRFRLLTGGSRTARPRHQTLSALIDWSYDLLSDPERVLLRRLSVFRGGWTLEAAGAISAVEPGGGGAEPDSPAAPGGPGAPAGMSPAVVLDPLTHLVDKSLVIAERQQGAEARYRMLETIRQYAWEKVLEAGEAGPLQARHLDFCLQLAEEAEPQLHGAAQKAWLARLETEHDNMRAALEYSRLDGADDEKGLRLAGALFWFWFIHNYVSQPRNWLRVALAQRGPSEPGLARAKGLFAAAGLGIPLGSDDGARAEVEESISIFRGAGPAGQRGLAYALVVRGWLVLGDRAAITSVWQESVALFREIGDKWGLALALNGLADVRNRPEWYSQLGGQGSPAPVPGLVAAASDDHTTDPSLYEESLALFRELGDRWAQTFPLGDLADMARYRGDYVTGSALAKECLAIQREFGDKLRISFSLVELGTAALAQDDLGQAASLYEESLTIYRGMGLLGSDGEAGLRDLIAEVARRRADYGPAEELLAQSLALRRKVGNQEGIANCLDGLGRVAGSRGDLAAAHSLQMEALAIRREGRVPISLAQSLHALAILGAAQQHPERAVRLFGAVEAFQGVLYNCGLPIWRAEHERAVAAVRVKLGEALFEAASAEGRAMTLEQAVAFTLADSTE